MPRRQAGEAGSAIVGDGGPVREHELARVRLDQVQRNAAASENSPADRSGLAR